MTNSNYTRVNISMPKHLFKNFVEYYTRVNISMPKHLFKNFVEYCKKEGMKPSSRIAILVKKDLEASMVKPKENEHP